MSHNNDLIPPHMQRLLCDAVSQMLVCPDDQGMIRARLGNTNEPVPGVGALAPGAFVDLVLPALGLNYCFGLGLEQSNLTAGDAYTVDVFRSGNIVAQYTRAELNPATANSERATACPCNICVGMVQSLTLRVTNTGTLAWAATAFLTFKACRKFGPLPRQTVVCEPFCNVVKGCG